LSGKEFIYPYLVFKKFLKFHNLQEWQDELYRLLYYALLSDSNSRAGVEIDYLGIYQLLQKLVEAAHLINLKGIKVNIMNSLT